jgi:hypothetical protein
MQLTLRESDGGQAQCEKREAQNTHPALSHVMGETIALQQMIGIIPPASRYTFTCQPL